MNINLITPIILGVITAVAAVNWGSGGKPCVLRIDFL